MWQRLTYTLVFIKNNSKILLGLKKRGFGEGKWNGFGGKVENNETIFEAAVRETKEECNLNVDALKYIGITAYEEINTSKIDIVHVFTTNKYSDILKESEEMKPEWFEFKNIPFQQMWPDGRIWYPLMLQDKYFYAHVRYENENVYKDTHIEQFNTMNLVLDYHKSLMHVLIED